MEYPNALRYTKSHEWVAIDGDQVTIGMTDFAQDDLGTIQFVELPEEGDVFEKGDSFVSVESDKAVSERYVPVTGTVLHINDELEDHPEWLNNAPYTKGWLVVLEVRDPSPLADLLTADQYAVLCDHDEAAD